MSLNPNKDSKEIIRLSGWSTSEGWKGTGQLVNGSWVDWMLTRTGDLEKTDEKKPGSGGDREKREVPG